MLYTCTTVHPLQYLRAKNSRKMVGRYYFVNKFWGIVNFFRLFGLIVSRALRKGLSMRRKRVKLIAQWLIVWNAYWGGIVRDNGIPTAHSERYRANLLKLLLQAMLFLRTYNIEVGFNELTMKYINLWLKTCNKIVVLLSYTIY